MAESDPARLDDVRETPLRAADYGKDAGDDSIAPWRMEPEGTRHWSEAIAHETANHGACPMQSRLDHFVAQPQAQPGFGRAQPLDVPEHEDKTIGFRQTVDRGFDHAMKLPRVGLMLGAWIGAGEQCKRRRRFAVANRRNAVRGSPARCRLVDDDPRQPGGELRTCFEPVEVGERVEVGLLQDVFDLDLVLDDCPCGAVEALIVPPHQDFKERPLACAHTVDEVSVRQG